MFDEGQMIDGFYKFNSYRLGYLRDVLTSDRWMIYLEGDGAHASTEPENTILTVIKIVNLMVNNKFLINWQNIMENF